MGFIIGKQSSKFSVRLFPFRCYFKSRLPFLMCNILSLVTCL